MEEYKLLFEFFESKLDRRAAIDLYRHLVEVIVTSAAMKTRNSLLCSAGLQAEAEKDPHCSERHAITQLDMAATLVLLHFPELIEHAVIRAMKIGDAIQALHALTPTLQAA